MNLPNAITIGRIALVPVFWVLAFKDSAGATAAALIVFIVASLSDFVDGYIARRDGKISRAGQFLDPTADKLLVGAALIALVGTREFPLWAAAVIVFREVAVTLLRMQIVRGGGDLPASNAAKLKTVTQIGMVGWWLLPWASTNAGHWILLVLGLITTLWSGAQYFLVARKPEQVSA